MIAFFRRAIEADTPLEAIGIGSFGPVELRPEHPRYGWITTTPKLRWANTDLVGPVASAFGLPVGFDTDVNATALGEGRWGAAKGLRSFVYLTLGTGIGGGAVADGRLVHGLGHPEMGHIAVARLPGDRFPGSCPYHGDCLEGMASGPAIEARFGQPAEALTGANQVEAKAIVANYVVSGCRSLVYCLAPQRIVVGGGVGSLPGLVPAIRAELFAQLGGYPGLPEHAEDSFIVSAGLGFASQGADIMPRRLIMVSAQPRRGGRSTVSMPARDGSDWYLLSDAKKHKGFSITPRTFPDRFVSRCLISKHVAPFVIAPPAAVVLPIERAAGHSWRRSTAAEIASSPAPRDHFKDIVEESDFDSMESWIDALDYRSKLTSQVFEPDSWLVVYGAGGGIPQPRMPRSGPSVMSRRQLTRSSTGSSPRTRTRRCSLGADQ